MNDIFEDPGDEESSWESEARMEVEKILENVEFDEVRGVVHLMSGTDHRYNITKEEFSSLEKIREMPNDRAEVEWINYVPCDNGPVFTPDVEDRVEHLLEARKIVEFFELVVPPYAGEELFSAQNLLLAKGGIQVRMDVEEINDELIRYLALHPEKMRDMHPRKFEELVAELFKDRGYTVELTPRTRDGGLDIRAYHRSDTGTLLGLIECKRYSADVSSEKASFGMIATTSTFTKGAKAFQAQNEYQMQLADFSIINN